MIYKILNIPRELLVPITYGNMRTPTFAVRHNALLVLLAHRIEYVKILQANGVKNGYDEKYSNGEEYNNFMNYQHGVIVATARVAKQKELIVERECDHLMLDALNIDRATTVAIKAAIATAVEDIRKSTFFIHGDGINSLIELRIAINFLTDADRVKKCKEAMDKLLEEMIANHCHILHVDRDDVSIMAEINRLVSEVQYVKNCDYCDDGLPELLLNPEYVPT